MLSLILFDGTTSLCRGSGTGGNGKLALSVGVEGGKMPFSFDICSKS